MFRILSVHVNGGSYFLLHTHPCFLALTTKLVTSALFVYVEIEPSPEQRIGLQVTQNEVHSSKSSKYKEVSSNC
jgi:hypothetical protein